MFISIKIKNVFKARVEQPDQCLGVIIQNYINQLGLFGGCYQCFYLRNPIFLFCLQPLSQWTSSNVVEWMAALNLYRYAELFKSKDIKGSDLITLDREKLMVGFIFLAFFTFFTPRKRPQNLGYPFTLNFGIKIVVILDTVSWS